MYIYIYIYTREKYESMVFEPETATDVLKSFRPLYNAFPCTTQCKVKLPRILTVVRPWGLTLVIMAVTVFISR